MRNTVFIHTNPKQAVGALVARHALIRNSAAPERFDVRIIDTSDFPAFERYEGRSYLREGKQAVWRNDDLQSFTPLRFAVPELMGYAGRAVLTDPDIFALADINLAARARHGRRRGAGAADAGRLAPAAALRLERDAARLRPPRATGTGRRTSRRPFAASATTATGCGCCSSRRAASRRSSRSGTTSTGSRPRRACCTTPIGGRSRGRPACPRTSRRAARPSARAPASGCGACAARARAATGAIPTRRRSGSSSRLLGECLDNGSVPASLLETEIARGHIRTDAHACIAQAQRAAA